MLAGIAIKCLGYLVSIGVVVSLWWRYMLLMQFCFLFEFHTDKIYTMKSFTALLLACVVAISAAFAPSSVAKPAFKSALSMAKDVKTGEFLVVWKCEMFQSRTLD